VQSVAERVNGSELAPPLQGALGQGLEQDAPQLTARHFGACSAPLVRLVEQDFAVRVDHSRRLPACVNDSAEPFVKASRLQGELTVVLVNVEHPTLRAGRRRRIGFENAGFDAVDLENASKNQASEAGANDCDAMHGLSI
jgi:hypothetical protein